MKLIDTRDGRKYDIQIDKLIAKRYDKQITMWEKIPFDDLKFYKEIPDTSLIEDEKIRETVRAWGELLFGERIEYMAVKISTIHNVHESKEEKIVEFSTNTNTICKATIAFNNNKLFRKLKRYRGNFLPISKLVGKTDRLE